MLKKLVAGAASCLLCLGLLAGLAGCQEAPAPVSSDPGPDLVSVPPPLSIDMTTLITAEQARQLCAQGRVPPAGSVLTPLARDILGGGRS